MMPLPHSVVKTENNPDNRTRNNRVIPTGAVASRSEAMAEWRDLLL